MVHVIPRSGRNRDNLAEMHRPRECVDQRKKRRFFHPIGFIDQKQDRRLDPFEEFKNGSIPGTDQGPSRNGSWIGLDEKTDEVDFPQGLGGDLDHPLVELELGAMYPWGVEEDDLALREVLYPQDPGSSGLRLIRDDRDLLAQDSV